MNLKPSHFTWILLWALMLHVYAQRVGNGNRNNRTAGGNSRPNSDFDGNIFLEKFGYLDDSPDHSHSPDTVKQAVTEFQRFNGLTVTGRMDKETVKKMKQPRCGMPDVIKPSRRPQGLRSRGPRAPLAYHAPGSKWEDNQVSYKFTSYTRQLPGSMQKSAISNAFRKWSDVTPLTFRENRGDVNIEIGFGRREHGDGYGNAFDGKGGTLAHAFFPGKQPIAGDTHFDDEEQWTIETERGTNLEIVAAHEFGHALGLGHSSNPKALMAPFYQGYDPDYKLDQDDIRGIQSLYGPNRRRPTVTQRPRYTTRRPTRRTRPTTRRPIYTPRPRYTTRRPRYTTRRPRYTSRPRITTRRPRYTSRPRITTRRPRYTPRPRITTRRPRYTPRPRITTRRPRYTPRPRITTRRPRYTPRPQITTRRPRYTPRPRITTRRPRYTPRPRITTRRPRYTPRPRITTRRPRYTPRPRITTRRPRYTPRPRYTTRRPVYTRRPRPTTRRPRPTTRRPRPTTRRPRPTPRPRYTTRSPRYTPRPRYTTRRPRYTPRPRPTRRPRRTTRRPRPTTRRPRPTTRRPRATTKRPNGRGPNRDNCNMRFDAIEQAHDGRIYVFRGRYIYTMSAQGPVNRKLIRQVFPGAPNKPGAAVYDRYTRKFYIFKGRRYWRFTGNAKDAGYPKTLPPDFRGTRAAFQGQDGGLYLFKGPNYTRWAESLTRYSAGYPRRVNTYWRGMPSNIEAAFRAYDGYYYIFKYQRYWRFNSLPRLSPGFPRSIRPVLLNCRRPSRIRQGGPELSYLTQKIRQSPTSD